MTSRVVIWLLCAGALALACGPHARHNESAASTPNTHPPVPKAIPTDDHVLATAATVSIHDGVHLTLRITNISHHAVELTFPSGETHDFVVIDSLGREVWRWSDGRMFTQALRNKLLDASETITYEEHWPARGRQGHFTAVALLKSSNHPVEERVAFTLP
jgi:hypothetical protein